MALSLIAEPGTVVFKSRPDVVIKPDFLRGKIANFARDCGTVPTSALGVAMPKPVLRNKVWTPWADFNQPFFYEDAAFMGRKDDLSTSLSASARSTRRVAPSPAKRSSSCLPNSQNLVYVRSPSASTA